MKKAFKKGLSLVLALIMILLSAPLQAISEFDFKSAFQTIAEAAEDLFSPPYILKEMSTIAINYGGEQYDGLSLSTQNLRMGVGDSEEFFVQILDENDNPVENFMGLSWSAYPSDAVILEVNPTDTRFCTVTILETDAQRVTITASAYGQTLTQYIDIIGNGVSFSSSEYYILVDSDNMVVSFDMSVLSASRATWTVSSDEYDSITEGDYEFTCSDESVLRIDGKHHSTGIGGIGQKVFYLYPQVYGVKEGTVTLTVNAGQDSDTCTVHVVPLKEYKIEAYSEDFEKPLADAEISTDIVITNSVGTKSLSGRTGEDGIVVLKLPDVDKCPAFDIRGLANFHPEDKISSKMLSPVEINRLPLKCEVELDGLSTSATSINALSTNIGDEIINLLSFNADIDIGDHFSIKLDIDYGDMTIKGTIEGSTSTECTISKGQSSAERKESYKLYKTLFKGLKSNQDCYDDWRALRKKARTQNAEIGISAEASIGGYVEFQFVNGKLKFKEGGIVVSGEAGYSKDIYTNIPAVYVAFEITGGFDVGFALIRVAEGTGVISNNLGFQVLVNFKVNPSAGVGVGCDLAKVEIGVSGDFNLTITYTSGQPLTIKQMLKITAKLSGYLEYKVDVWIIKWGDKFELDIAEAELFPNPSAKFAWQSKSLENNSFELMPRDYLYEEVVQTQSLTAEMHITNTYPNGAPQIETLNNGTKVAVWLADNGIKSGMNRTTLMYSQYNGISWSEPRAVCETGRLDGNPELCSDGERAYVLWLRGEEVFSDNVSFEEYLTKTELAFSSFDGSSWSTPAVVGNSNDRYQLYYSIAANDGDVTISWTENDKNDAFLSSGNTSVYQQNYVNGSWSTPSLAIKTAKTFNSIASGYIDGSPKVAYSVDEDGQYSTTGDNRVYVSGNCVTPDNGIDYLGLSYCNGMFYFTGGGNLYAYNGRFVSTNTPVGKNHNISSNGNSYAMTYCIDSEDVDFSNEIYACYSDDGITFTDPIQLTSYNNNIKEYDFVMNADGSLTVCTDLRYLGTDSIFAHTDFVIETFGDKYEVELMDANFDMSIGETKINELTFEAVVKNQSAKSINGFSVHLIDASGSIVNSNIYSKTVESGEVVSVEMNYVLPADYDGSSFTLQIVPYNDTDFTNNSYEFIFEYADVVVENCGITADRKLKAVVTNNGYDVAEDVNVKFFKFVEENEELNSLNIGDLGIGESVQVEYQIPEDKIVFDSYLSDNIFEVEASTSVGEINYANNSASAIISPVHVTGVAFEQSRVVLAPNDVIQLNANVLPVDATDKTVYWFTSDENIVSVDENGRLTANKLGTVTVSAITADGQFKAVCTVTVSTTVPVTGIEVQPKETSVLVGSTKQLTANVLPSNATDKTVYWSSDNASVASVSNTGLVTGKATGTVTITARSKDGNYRASCVVTVVSTSIPVTGVEIQENSVFMDIGETKQLHKIISPANATNTNVTWSSNNNNVSVDSNGYVTALKSGFSVVKVTTADGGYEATCLVTVRVQDVSVTGVSISKNSMTVEVGDTSNLYATVKPENATNKNVVWLSSDTSVVQVDSTGKITAVGAGVATVTVRTEDGGFVSQCTVTVTEPIGHGRIVSVSLNSAPNTTSYKYKYKDDIDLTGLTLKVTYSDGSSEIITDTSKMTVSELDTSSTGTKNIDVTYEGYTVSFKVEVKYTIIQWIIMILLLGWLWY